MEIGIGRHRLLSRSGDAKSRWCQRFDLISDQRTGIRQFGHPSLNVAQGSGQRRGGMK